MKVSIIIPVYNVEKYIERCINSVIRQTYPNIECIIVDDCCTDNSIRICEYIIDNYNGPISFLILRHQQSEGPSGARNTGTDAATGEYIFYLDSDDEITEDCIRLLHSAVIKYPRVEIVQGCTVSKNLAIYHTLEKYKNVSYINDNNWIRQEFYQFKDTLPILVWNKLINKEFLVKNNIRFKDNIIHEDILWVYSVVKHLRHFCLIHKNTYVHYVVPMSIMTSLNKKRSDNSWEIVLSEIASSIDEPCFELQIRKYLYEFLMRFDNDKRKVYILNNFILNSCKNKKYKIYLALTAYKYFNNWECASSLKQWLITFCIHGNKKNLMNEIFCDFKHFIHKKIKKTDYVKKDNY